MDINSAPKLKDTKLKIKKTFAISADAADVYNRARTLGVDTTKMCTDSIEDTLSKIKKMISTQSV